MIDFEKLAAQLPPHVRLNMAMGMLLAGEVVLSCRYPANAVPGRLELAGAIYDASQVLDPDGTSRLLAILHALALKAIDDEDVDEDHLPCDRCDEPGGVR